MSPATLEALFDDHFAAALCCEALFVWFSAHFHSGTAGLCFLAAGLIAAAAVLLTVSF